MCPTLWLSPLFLILLASLPVDRTNRDRSTSKEPGMVCVLHPPSVFSFIFSVFLLPLYYRDLLRVCPVAVCRSSGLLPFQLKQQLWVLKCSQKLHERSPSNRSCLYIRLRKSDGQNDRVEKK